MSLSPKCQPHMEALAYAALPRHCLTDSTAQEPTGTEEWLSVKAQRYRHDSLQLTKPKAATFIRDCEFVSLGSYCAVARALQCVGVKRFSYPFDWVRSSSEGVINCLEAKFEGFLSYAFTFEHEGMKVYGGSKWGGSFWHHDPDAASTQTDMARRVDRLFGKAEVPASRMRVFVHAVNSSSELELCIRLHQVLRRALPETHVYLLILVDFQTSLGPVCLSGHDSLIIWRVHESNHPMENGTGKWAQTGKWTMQKQSEAYSQGLAFAIRLWSGEEGLFSQVRIVPDLMALCQACDAFAGSDPTKELWLPKKIQQNVSRKVYMLAPSKDLMSSQASVDTDASTSFVSRSASDASTPSLDRHTPAQPPTHLNLTPATMESKTVESFGNDHDGWTWPQAAVDARLSQTFRGDSAHPLKSYVRTRRSSQPPSSLSCSGPLQGSLVHVPMQQLQGSVQRAVHQAGSLRFPLPAQRAAHEAGITSHVTACSPTIVFPVKHLATKQYVQQFFGQLTS